LRWRVSVDFVHRHLRERPVRPTSLTVRRSGLLSDDIALRTQFAAGESFDIEGAHVDERLIAKVEVAQDLADRGALEEPMPGEAVA
jgi:hypothetical protein